MPPRWAREAVKAGSIAELEAALARRQDRRRAPSSIVIDTDPYPSTPSGGHWWDVAVPEVSARPEVRGAQPRADYEAQLEIEGRMIR